MLCCHVLLPCYVVVLGLSLCSVVLSLVVMRVLSYIYILFNYHFLNPSPSSRRSFERHVKDHITSTLPDTLDPLQFAYRPNRSIDDAITIALHTVLSHLEYLQLK